MASFDDTLKFSVIDQLFVAKEYDTIFRPVRTKSFD
jgi:hypothetical protein